MINKIIHFETESGSSERIGEIEKFLIELFKSNDVSVSSTLPALGLIRDKISTEDWRHLPESIRLDSIRAELSLAASKVFPNRDEPPVPPSTPSGRE